MNSTLKLMVIRNMKRYLPLLLITLFSMVLLLIRVKITQSAYYMFLIWNLFLAALPLLTSIVLQSSKRISGHTYLFYTLLVTWLLLLPNAPYLVTDLVHFRRESSVPFWLDLLILGAFSISGFLFGLASMKNVYNVLLNRWTRTMANIFMITVCMLSGMGIYIGRVMRYNSWDILTRPITLLKDIFTTMTSSDTYPAALGITLGFGLLQFLLFDLYTTSEK